MSLGFPSCIPRPSRGRQPSGHTGSAVVATGAKAVETIARTAGGTVGIDAEALGSDVGGPPRCALLHPRMGMPWERSSINVGHRRVNLASVRSSV